MSDGREKEPEKGKAGPNDVIGGAQKNPREDNGEEAAVKEEEVEEFFAILRRIHVAVNYFKNRNVDSRNLTDGGSLALALESTDVAVDDSVKETEDVEENVGFDLNSNPDPDPDPSLV